MATADITADGVSFSFHSLRFVVKLYKDFSLDSVTWRSSGRRCEKVLEPSGRAAQRSRSEVTDEWGGQAIPLLISLGLQVSTVYG